MTIEPILNLEWLPEADKIPPQIKVYWDNYFVAAQNNQLLFWIPLFVFLLFLVRKFHIWQIYRLLHRKQTVQPNEPTLWTDRFSKFPSPLDLDFKKIAIHPITVSAIECLFQWSRIDLKILEAFDNSCKKKIFHSYKNLREHLEKFLEKQSYSFPALITRYPEDIPKKRIADYLVSQGHYVQEIYPYHPKGYNALVDGQKVVFKGSFTPLEINHLQAKKSKYPIFIFEGLQDSWEAEESITVLPFEGERGGKIFQNIFERFMIEGKEFGAVRHSSGIGRLVGQVAGNLLGDDEDEDIVYEHLFGFLGNMTEKFLNTLGPDRELRKAYQKLTVLFSQYPDPYAKALLLKAQTLSGNVTFLTQTQHGTWIWPDIASIVKNSIVQRYDSWAKNCHTMAQEVTRNLADIRSEPERVGLGQKIFFSRNYEVVYSNKIARIRSEIWKNFNIIIEKRETLRPDLSQKIFPKKRYLWEN